ncbi:MAG: HAD family hydrolase [Candidatus Sumerlaeia bacterium]
MIKAVIFDLDETLLDRKETMQRFLRDQHARFNGQLRHATADSYAEKVLFHQKNGYAKKWEAYRNALAELGIEDANPQTLFQDYLDNYGAQPVLFAETVPVLEKLAGKYKLGIITNGRIAGQNRKVDHSGIRPYFATVLTSEAAGVEKPDARIFHKCLEALNVSPEESVCVGDHPEYDVEGAIGAGLRGIWMRCDHFDPPAKHHGMISNLNELPPMLDQFASA